MFWIKSQNDNKMLWGVVTLVAIAKQNLATNLVMSYEEIPEKNWKAEMLIRPEVYT